MICPGGRRVCPEVASLQYPDELRERGVRLVFESGRPTAHVARDSGVHRETLRLWVRQAEADTAEVRGPCLGRMTQSDLGIGASWRNSFTDL